MNVLLYSALVELVNDVTPEIVAILFNVAVPVTVNDPPKDVEWLPETVNEFVIVVAAFVPSVGAVKVIAPPLVFKVIAPPLVFKFIAPPLVAIVKVPVVFVALIVLPSILMLSILNWPFDTIVALFTSDPILIVGANSSINVFAVAKILPVPVELLLLTVILRFLADALLPFNV